MPRPSPWMLFATTALALLGLGLVQSAWWTIAGGIAAGAAAAWLVTEEG